MHTRWKPCCIVNKLLSFWIKTSNCANNSYVRYLCFVVHPSSSVHWLSHRRFLALMTCSTTVQSHLIYACTGCPGCFGHIFQLSSGNLISFLFLEFYRVNCAFSVQLNKSANEWNTPWTSFIPLCVQSRHMRTSIRKTRGQSEPELMHTYNEETHEIEPCSVCGTTIQTSLCERAQQITLYEYGRRRFPCNWGI